MINLDFYHTVLLELVLGTDCKAESTCTDVSVSM